MKQKWPDIRVDDYSAAIDFIIKFYQELGWNLVQAIDPVKNKIHPEAWGDIADQLRDKWGLSAALVWMNIGPSADESGVYNLAKDEVFIGEGAIKNCTKEVG